MTRRFAFIFKPVSGRAGWGSGTPENDLVLEQQSRPKWRTFKKKKNYGAPLGVADVVKLKVSSH
jgi:hypothetical protein